MSYRRLYEIDILRFIAALMVVLFHYTIDTSIRHHTTLISSNFLNFLFLHGKFGVSLFFLISGFVILMSVQPDNPAKFIKARIVRLYPAFIPICILTFIIAKTFEEGYNVSIRDFLINVSLVGLFATWYKIQLVTGTYWTLIVEMQFYFLILILIIFKKVHHIRIFLMAWLTLSILTYFGELYFNFHTIFNKIRILFLTEHSYYFIAGCYFYLIKYKRKSYDLIMPILCLMMKLLWIINSPHTTFTFSSIGIVTSVFIIFYVITLKDLVFTKYAKFYVILGNLTYPLYLLHELIGDIIISFLLPYFNKTLLFIFMILLMLGLAYLFNRFIEKPVMGWMKKAIN